MPQLVESCGMFFYPHTPPFPISSKKHAFYFVLSPICAIFAVSKIYADESTHSKYK